jgi:hypothetical protein
MYFSWEKDLYKTINMSTIQGYPNKIPKESNKWLPKFPRNNVVTIEDPLYVMGQDMENVGIKHEDVAMRIFASSFTKEALDWFIAPPRNHLTSYEYFANLFKSIWSTKTNDGTLGDQFNQIQKRENETVKEFNTIFDRLYNQIPTVFFPTPWIVPMMWASCLSE